MQYFVSTQTNRLWGRDPCGRSQAGSSLIIPACFADTMGDA